MKSINTWLILVIARFRVLVLSKFSGGPFPVKHPPPLLQSILSRGSQIDQLIKPYLGPLMKLLHFLHPAIVLPLLMIKVPASLCLGIELVLIEVIKYVTIVEGKVYLR